MSQLGLGLNLSKTKGGVVPFNPLSLDPYLLFDSETSMRGTLEGYTLDLDPATPSSLDVITASRTGVATYTDADGLIQTAAADTVRVDHTQGEQLTPTKYQRVSNTDYFSSPNFAENTTLQYVTGPTGELDAVRVTEDATTDYHYLAMRADVVSGTTYAISFYIKQGSYPTARVFTQSLYMVKNTTVNFSAETASGGGIMENVGDGWYRVTFTGTSNLTGTMIVYATVTNLNSYAGDVNNFTDYYGFQVEEGTTASSFVANTTGSPKFITGATYGPRVPMILVEPSSENIITRSEDFSFSGWTKLGASVANGISSPDGNNTAFKLTEDASASGHYLQETVTVSSATIYTASIFVKFESREWIRFTDAESINRVHFNTRTGQFGTVVGTVIAYSSTELDDGWHRITITSTSAGTGYSMRIILAESDNDVAYTGDGTSGIYVWGAQLETGSVATSYIPTSGGNAAARTRAADDLVISGSAFTDFFNGSEGTVYAEFVPKRNDDYRHVYEFSNGTTGQRINLHLVGGSAVFYSQSNGATYQYSTNTVSGATTGVLHRSAFSYKTNDAPASFDGGAEIPDTEYSVPSGINRLYLGDYTPRDGNYLLTGHIKRLIYWPTHSDNL